MILQHNLEAMNSMRMLGVNVQGKAKNTEKLSSGYRINRASDDAAGLSMSEKMRRQVRGLSQASKNVEEGIGYVQTADGALNEVHDILQRINELSVKAANDTLTPSDRYSIDCEIQHLKSEMTRVFSDTTFNERKIWNPDTNNKVVIGYEPKQAAEFNRQYSYCDITDANVDMLANSSGYKLTMTPGSTSETDPSASTASSFSLSWTSLDGTSYTTEPKTLEELGIEGNKDASYSFKFSDFATDPQFYDENGKFILNDFPISFSTIEAATIEDICGALNNTTFSSSPSDINAPVTFQDTGGNNVGNKLVSPSAVIYFKAAYKSNSEGTDDPMTFDAGMDSFIEPVITGTTNMTECPTSNTVEAAKNDSTSWKFAFKMDGIGDVTAKCNSISYSSGDITDEGENVWWRWVRPYRSEPYKAGISRNVTTDLKGIMSALTGGLDTDTPGLIDSTHGSGGSISMRFMLTSASGNVGEIHMGFGVSTTETEQDVLDRILEGFNNTTIMDLQTADGNVNFDSFMTVGPAHEKTLMVQDPIYDARNSFFVQAGAEAGQHIDIVYDCLSIHKLGLATTDVLTAKNAAKAIVQTKSAIQTVSRQRSDFGAYQNRLEHAVNSLDTMVENNQAAESRIRDTDMATESVAASINDILIQAGQSVLAQANQSKQSVMTLLEGVQG